MTTQQIYNDIEQCLIKKESFSIFRFLTEISIMASKNLTEMRSITQGIPQDKVNELVDIFLKCANGSDYIASPEFWLTDDYINKKIKKTSRFRRWKDEWKEVGITNTNICNPDIGYLLFIEGSHNLWNIIKDKRICLMTSKIDLVDKMRNQGKTCDLLSIPTMTTRLEYKKDMKEPLSGQWHWNHYEKIKDFLTKYHQDYDIFLIGAGHLAKGYSIHIKELGGIALDVGKVMDSWNGEGLGRMKQLITMNNDFSFKLTKEGKQYEGKF